MDKLKVGFIVNPIAGMGGRVGLKGTDGEDILRMARKLGAKPVSDKRAIRFLRSIGGYNYFIFYTAPGKMGEKYLKLFRYKYIVVGRIRRKTSGEDTRRIALEMLKNGIEILVFVGGDGTARDIVEAVNRKVPILGIPSGVKIYSSVFAATPEDGGRVLIQFYKHRLLKNGEILDIDENAFREDRINIKIYAYALTPDAGLLMQNSKEIFFSQLDEENKKSIAKYIVETMDKDTVYILGSGTTIKAVTDYLGLPKTVLGIDVMYDFSIVKRDVSEKGLLNIIKNFHEKNFKIIVSPLGRQGYIFGRGNQQISPRVIRKVGLENIIIIATKSKLRETPFLRVDTGDKNLDERLRGYRRVIIDYNEEKMVKII